MDLLYYLNIAGRRWWLLLLPPLIAGAVALIASESLPDKYEGEVTILINQSRVQGLPPTYTELLASAQIAATYAELVKQRPVLVAVINELDLSYTVREFSAEISVKPILDTQLIVVKVKDRDPARAAVISNLLVEKFIGINEADLGRPGTVSVVSPAVPPENRAEPDVLLYTALAVILGILVAVGLVLLWENLESAASRVGRHESENVLDRG